MTKDTTKAAAVAANIMLFDNWFDPIEDGVRERVRGFIEKARHRAGDSGTRPMNKKGPSSLRTFYKACSRIEQDFGQPQAFQKSCATPAKKPQETSDQSPASPISLIKFVHTA